MVMLCWTGGPISKLAMIEYLAFIVMVVESALTLAMALTSPDQLTNW